jgi:hypothetical protein
LPVRDSSLRALKLKKVVGIQILKKNNKNENQKTLPFTNKNQLNSLSADFQSTTIKSIKKKEIL